jgi:hypothetical protein
VSHRPVGREPLKQYDVISVVSLRDDRFSKATPSFVRHPQIGDVGTIVEVYSRPEPGFEVECVEPSTGTTVWLETMYPGELAPFPPGHSLA